jgi:hypothetical protein
MKSQLLPSFISVSLLKKFNHLLIILINGNNISNNKIKTIHKIISNKNNRQKNANKF